MARLRGLRMDAGACLELFAICPLPFPPGPAAGADMPPGSLSVPLMSPVMSPSMSAVGGMLPTCTPAMQSTRFGPLPCLATRHPLLTTEDISYNAKLGSLRVSRTRQGRTRGMYGFQAGMACPDTRLIAPDMYSSGLGPTTRCAKSTTLSSLGTADTKLP